MGLFNQISPIPSLSGFFMKIFTPGNGFPTESIFSGNSKILKVVLWLKVSVIPYVLYTGIPISIHLYINSCGMNSPPNKSILKRFSWISLIMSFNIVGTIETIFTLPFFISSKTSSFLYLQMVTLVPLYKLRNNIDKPLTWKMGSITSQLSSLNTPNTCAEAFTCAYTCFQRIGTDLKLPVVALVFMITAICSSSVSQSSSISCSGSRVISSKSRY